MMRSFRFVNRQNPVDGYSADLTKLLLQSDGNLAVADAADTFTKSPFSLIIPTIGLVTVDEETYQTVKYLLGGVVDEMEPKFLAFCHTWKISPELMCTAENARLSYKLHCNQTVEQGLLNWLRRRYESNHSLWNSDGTINPDQLPSDLWTSTEIPGIGHIPIPRAYENQTAELLDYMYAVKKHNNHPIDNRPRIGEFDFEEHRSRLTVLFKWWEANFMLKRPSGFDKGYGFPTSKPFPGSAFEPTTHAQSNDHFDIGDSAAKALNNVVPTGGYQSPFSRFQAASIALSTPQLARPELDLTTITNLIGSSRRE